MTESVPCFPCEEQGLCFIEPEFLNEGDRLDVLPAAIQFFFKKKKIIREKHIKQNIGHSRLL